MKTINTLIEDMHTVLEGKGGWDEAVSEFFSSTLGKIAFERFSKPQEPRVHLGLSAVGKPCDLQKWYTVNMPEAGEQVNAATLGNFFWGDMVEVFVISLAMAAGHRVEGLQEKLDVYGIPGAGDCIIDGHVIDVKSASDYSFTKFKYNQLKGYYKNTKTGRVWVPASEVDGFGYISQLSSYLKGYQDDPRVHDKENASFLAVNKNKFALTLDTYNFKEELANKKAEIEHAIAVVEGPRPSRGFSDEEDGKSGNRKLGFQCSYCSFRKDCWPNTRTFLYSNGPRHLTKVVREPIETVVEIKQ